MANNYLLLTRNYNLTNEIFGSIETFVYYCEHNINKLDFDMNYVDNFWVEPNINYIEQNIEDVLNRKYKRF